MAKAIGLSYAFAVGAFGLALMIANVRHLMKRRPKD